MSLSCPAVVLGGLRAGRLCFEADGITQLGRIRLHFLLRNLLQALVTAITRRVGGGGGGGGSVLFRRLRLRRLGFQRYRITQLGRVRLGHVLELRLVR